MFIAILDLRTTPAQRPAALAQLDSERDEIRAMPGNLDLRVYAARDDEEAVPVIHEWADEPSFAGYLSSDAFARSGAVLLPLVTSPPVSRRFRADLLETVWDFEAAPPSERPDRWHEPMPPAVRPRIAVVPHL
jgi:quinol monooxygenase YgiN